MLVLVLLVLVVDVSGPPECTMSNPRRRSLDPLEEPHLVAGGERAAIYQVRGGICRPGD